MTILEISQQKNSQFASFLFYKDATFLAKKSLNFFVELFEKLHLLDGTFVFYNYFARIYMNLLNILDGCQTNDLI